MIVGQRDESKRKTGFKKKRSAKRRLNCHIPITIRLIQSTQSYNATTSPRDGTSIYKKKGGGGNELHINCLSCAWRLNMQIYANHLCVLATTASPDFHATTGTNFFFFFFVLYVCGIAVKSHHYYNNMSSFKSFRKEQPLPFSFLWPYAKLCVHDVSGV